MDINTYSIENNIILGAIIGDIAGSTIETTFPDYLNWDCVPLEELLKKGHFTDDTILTIAALDSIKKGYHSKQAFHRWGNKYKEFPGFSKNFKSKFLDLPETEALLTEVHSGANGALMMLSPYIAYSKADHTGAVLATHDCIEAIVCSDWYVKYGQELKNRSSTDPFPCFDDAPFLPFNATFDVLAEERHWDMSSIITLRNAFACLISSKSYEEVIKKALYLGGDADTVAAVAGGLAAARFGVPDNLKKLALDKLTGEMIDVLN